MALLITSQWLLLLLWLFLLQAISLVQSGGCTKPDLNISNVNMSAITENSFVSGKKLRLTCNNGYVREAGTSNLIRCQANQWSKHNLNCIRSGGHPPLTTTPSTEAPKEVTLTDNDTTAKTTITTAEPTTAPISDLHRTSTTDLTGVSGGHRLAPEATLAARSVETTTAATDKVTTHSGQPRTTATDKTGNSDLGPGLLLSTRTAVRSTVPSPATAETEFTRTVLSEETQTATAETTVTNTAEPTAGEETLTTTDTLSQTAVTPFTTGETATDVQNTTEGTTGNAKLQYNKKVTAIVGGTSGVAIFIIGGLVLLWLFIVKRKLTCRMTSLSSEYEMETTTPISRESWTVATKTSVNETEPLRNVD